MYQRMTSINESIDNLTTKLSKSDLNDSFKEKVIRSLKSLCNLNLKSSDEGSTNDGDHETGVSNALIKLGFPIIEKKYVEHTKRKNTTYFIIITKLPDYQITIFCPDFEKYLYEGCLTHSHVW